MRWRGHFDKLSPRRTRVAQVTHHPALPYTEIGDVWGALEQQPGVAARALEFTVLTAARTSEVITATWDEFDLEARVWNVPAAKMKAKRPHRVPLSAAALTILQTMRAMRYSDYVFPSSRVGKPPSGKAMLMALRRMGHGYIMVHGFRTTFRDWCAEQTKFPREVAEAAVAHVVKD